MYQVIIKEKDNIIIQKEINDIQELEKILPSEYKEIEVKRIKNEKE